MGGVKIIRKNSRSFKILSRINTIKQSYFVGGYDFIIHRAEEQTGNYECIKAKMERKTTFYENIIDTKEKKEAFMNA